MKRLIAVALMSVGLLSCGVDDPLAPSAPRLIRAPHLSIGANAYTITDLGTLGGTYAVANDINNVDQVVGESFTAGNASRRAFLWQNGTMTDLGTLGGTYSSANGINAGGQVVGVSPTAGDAEVHAVLWTVGVDTDGDGVPDNVDNCPTTPNPNQADIDGDGIGDACDPSNDPTSVQQCANGGWQLFGFKNEKDCVKFVEKGKDKRDKKK
jgi:probable HAF family extracellular repeat protein